MKKSKLDRLIIEMREQSALCAAAVVEVEDGISIARRYAGKRHGKGEGATTLVHHVG